MVVGEADWIVACSEAVWKPRVLPDHFAVMMLEVQRKHPPQVLIQRPDPPSSKNVIVSSNFNLLRLQIFDPTLNNRKRAKG
jgi:hypothetical protein